MFRKTSIICIIVFLICATVVSGSTVRIEEKNSQFDNEFDGKKIILFGEIDNLYLNKESNFIEFNAIKLKCVFFAPVKIISFESAEHITLKGRFIGLITPCFILGISTFKHFEKYTLFFNSHVVDLLNYTFKEIKDGEGNVVELDIYGCIENKLNKKINVELKAEFYDKDDACVGEKTFKIFGLREKGQPGSSTTFTISYDGDSVDRIDHAKLVAKEYP